MHRKFNVGSRIPVDCQTATVGLREQMTIGDTTYFIPTFYVTNESSYVVLDRPMYMETSAIENLYFFYYSYFLNTIFQRTNDVKARVTLRQG